MKVDVENMRLLARWQ